MFIDIHMCLPLSYTRTYLSHTHVLTYLIHTYLPISHTRTYLSQTYAPYYLNHTYLTMYIPISYTRTYLSHTHVPTYLIHTYLTISYVPTYLIFLLCIIRDNVDIFFKDGVSLWSLTVDTFSYHHYGKKF